LRKINSEIRKIVAMPDDELMTAAKELGAPFALLQEIRKLGKLPVPNFSAGGVATPADAALVMQLGAEAVFVGSGIFKSEDSAAFAKAIVAATARYKDPSAILKASKGLPKAMDGLEIAAIPSAQIMAARGW
jgi:pyridoxal 5'-phosphate synthase pdxS subunit